MTYMSDEEEGNAPWKVPKWYPFNPNTTTSTGATGVNINLAIPPISGGAYPGGTAIIAVAGCNVSPVQNITSCTFGGVAGTLLLAQFSTSASPISIFAFVVPAAATTQEVSPTATGTMTNGYACGGIMLYPGDSNLASFTPIDTDKQWYVGSYTSTNPLPLNHGNNHLYRGLSMCVLSKTGTGATTWNGGSKQDDLTFASSAGKFSIAVQAKYGEQNISASFASATPSIAGLSWTQ